MDAVRPRGRIVLVGLAPRAGEADWLRVVVKEVEMVGSIGHVVGEDYATAVDLVATGRVDAGALVTHRFPLSDAMRAFELLAGPSRGETQKVLIGRQQ